MEKHWQSNLSTHCTLPMSRYDRETGQRKRRSSSLTCSWVKTEIYSSASTPRMTRALHKLRCPLRRNLITCRRTVTRQKEFSLRRKKLRWFDYTKIVSKTYISSLSRICSTDISHTISQIRETLMTALGGLEVHSLNALEQVAASVSQVAANASEISNNTQVSTRDGPKLYAPPFCTKLYALPCYWMIDWMIDVRCLQLFLPFFLKNHSTCGVSFSFILRISTTHMGRLDQAEFGWIVFEKLRFQKCV